MYLHSKPHTIRGFKFEGKKTIFPEWFILQVATGGAQVVIDSTKKKPICHVTLYDKEGNFRKAYDGDWICTNISDTLFPLKDSEVEAYFTKGEDENDTTE